MHVKRNPTVRSCNHCCSGTAICVTYSECVFVAIVIQPAIGMCHFVICGLPGSTLFSKLSQKHYGFRKYFTEHKICVFIFSIRLPQTFLILRRNERAMIKKNSYWSSCWILVSFVRVQLNLSFLNRFKKKISKYQISWKSVQLEPSCSMRTEGDE